MGLKDSVLALVVIFSWGLNFVILAIGLEDIPPLFLGFIRFTLVASIGSLFISRPKIPIRWWVMYALPIGFLQFAFLFVAMANGMPSGLASLVLQAQALFTMLFSVLLLREQVRLFQIIAIAIAGTGLSLIALESEVGGMTLFGFLLTLLGAASWAFGNISARKLSELGFKPDLKLVVWSSWIPPVPFLVMSLLFEGQDVVVDSMLNVSWPAIAAVVYVAVVATIVGYTIWGYLLSRYPASQVAPLTLGVPIVGLTASSFILDENLGLVQWFGVALVLLGLIFNAFGAKLISKITPKKRFENQKQA